MTISEQTRVGVEALREAERTAWQCYLTSDHSPNEGRARVVQSQVRITILRAAATSYRLMLEMGALCPTNN